MKKEEPIPATPSKSPAKGRKGKKDEPEVWKWWEEKKEKDDGTKWKFLEHRGPLFAPAYDPLPPHVKFYYNGKPMRLSEEAEEVATFYGRMIDHDYTTKEVFNKNFFKVSLQHVHFSIFMLSALGSRYFALSRLSIARENRYTERGQKRIIPVFCGI